MSNSNIANQSSVRRRFRKRWIVVLLLALVLGPYLFFRATSFSRKIQAIENSVSSTTEFKGDIRVAVWNIAHGRGQTFSNMEEGGAPKRNRVIEIANEIKKFDADLVVLNEVDFCATWSGGYDQADLIAEHAGYRYIVKQSNLDFGFIYGRWHFGNALLSKFPISDVEVVSFAPVNDWEGWVVGSKRGLGCTVELQENLKLSVIGLHLESRGENVRVQEARDVADFFSRQEYPVLLMGDLNTTPQIAPQSNVSTDGENAFETLITGTGLSYSPKGVPQELEFTFSSMNPQSVIDWILFEPGELELLDQKVVRSPLSDHFPVVAEFRIQNRSGPSGEPTR